MGQLIGAEERGNHEALSYITKHDQDKQGKMTAKDIESVMKNAETSINHRQSASGSLHVPNRLNSLQGFNGLPRPSNVSIMTSMSEYGETEFLNMQSQIATLTDRVEE